MNRKVRVAIQRRRRQATTSAMMGRNRLRPTSKIRELHLHCRIFAKDRSSRQSWRCSRERRRHDRRIVGGDELAAALDARRANRPPQARRFGCAPQDARQACERLRHRSGSRRCNRTRVNRPWARGHLLAMDRGARSLRPRPSTLALSAARLGIVRQHPRGCKRPKPGKGDRRNPEPIPRRSPDPLA